jgi:ubiquinone/menaquinone biosynthesis C-methylase UbiE
MGMPAWRILWLFGKLGKRMHVVRQQVVRIEDVFGDTDRILDLGGGGAGVIGQLRGQQVTAVDIRQEELDGSPPGPIKVAADARALPFPDGSFDAATAFFFLMYVPAADRAAVLQEAHRALRPGGTLHVWDVVIPARGKRTHSCSWFLSEHSSPIGQSRRPTAFRGRAERCLAIASRSWRGTSASP